MVKALAHVCIHARDLAVTEAFYCGVLGLSVQFRFMKGDKLIGYYLKVADDQFLEFFIRGETPEGYAPINHLCLEVEDIQQLHSDFVSRELECTAPKLGADHSWQMWTKDPDGTRIEFHQYTDASTQRSGQDVEVDW